jgi:hypothetical protein
MVQFASISGTAFNVDRREMTMVQMVFLENKYKIGRVKPLIFYNPTGGEPKDPHFIT